MYFGDFKLGRPVHIPFNTFDSNDPQASVTITNLANTDIHIHKDDGTTQRNNAAGVTVNINFDSITGNHLVVIDTSDETVNSFWQVGHDYQVRMEGTTVDAGTINAWIGAFSIENRYNPSALTPEYSVTTDWEQNEQNKLSGLGIITTLSEDTGKSPIFQWELDELSTAGMVSTDRPRHEVNLGSISNDYDSANNAELDYDGTGYNKSASTIATVTNGVALAATATSAQLVDDIWDEVITAAAHNGATSAAKFLREASSSVAAVTGTAQAGAAGSITLASGAVGTDNKFNNERVAIIDGTGAGQSRLIQTSTAADDVCTLYANWVVNPDSTSVYAIIGAETDIRAIAGQSASATGAVDFDDLASILTDTNELQGDWVNGGRLDLLLDQVISDIAALNNLSAAQVNAEVVDALATDTYAEPGQGAPAATASLAAKINYLYKAWRNKKDNDGTTTNLYADDGTTVDQKQSTAESGGTVTKGEWTTGP